MRRFVKSLLKPRTNGSSNIIGGEYKHQNNILKTCTTNNGSETEIQIHLMNLNKIYPNNLMWTEKTWHL